jgi:hypothetical protein
MQTHPEKPHLMDNGAAVMMGTKRYVKEHKRLIKVLDKCGAKKEAAKQSKELMDVTKSKSKGKGSMPNTKMRRDSGSSMSSYGF